MTPEERAVLNAALKWHRTLIDQRSPHVSHAAQERLKAACQALRISDQPEHTVDPIPCMAPAPHSATMFCILPRGHDMPEGVAAMRRDRPWWTKVHHMGYAGGNPDNGRRAFRYSAFQDTMEWHERSACARFPGCERHP